MIFLGYLCLMIAWVGHGYWLMSLVNWVYSHPWHRKFLKLFRFSVGFLILSTSPIFIWLWDIDFQKLKQTVVEDPFGTWFGGYLWLCFLLGAVWLPAITVQRLLRRQPSEILEEKSFSLDTVAILGASPIGDGKHRGMAGLPFNDIFNVDFTTITLALPDLPAAWDGLTLLQLSDLHFYGSPSPDYFRVVIEKCMAEGVPDLLLITGDIVDSPQHLAWITPLLQPLKWNIAAFAILGNHDWWQDFDNVRQQLHDLGMQVVSNRWTTQDVKGSPLLVAGHEGPWFRPAPDVSQMPTEGFRLLLSHTPDNLSWAIRNHFRLMLSGHNHGGQLRLPILGSIFVPSFYGRRYDCGTFSKRGTVLHVNRGLSGKEPIRFRCPPQVTRFILRRANPT